MLEHSPLILKVWGDYACFTRPEMKVERVSYPIMTPSAARGVLEAIFWKPEFVWRILEIQLLKEIRHYSILRNEVKSRNIHTTASKWINSDSGYFADDDRTQRHSLILRDVAYNIVADMRLKPHCKDDIAKFRDMFRRRVNKGQYYHHPYLGCREFEANFSWSDDNDKPIYVTDDLGLMINDLDYDPDGSGRGKPLFFQARIINGILHIPTTPAMEDQQ